MLKKSKFDLLIEVLMKNNTQLPVNITAGPKEDLSLKTRRFMRKTTPEGGKEVILSVQPQLPGKQPLLKKKPKSPVGRPSKGKAAKVGK